MKDQSITLKHIQEQLLALLEKARAYSVVIFLVFVIAIYGFLLIRIQRLSSTQPSNVAVNSQVNQANIPHIDENILRQLQNLQDNSVSVQALFNQARNNPFQ